MSLQIGLVFGIFMSSNGEVSCEHYTYELPMTPSFFVYSKLEFHLHSSSIYIPFPSMLPFVL
jgi:hypothetical protein